MAASLLRHSGISARSLARSFSTSLVAHAAAASASASASSSSAPAAPAASQAARPPRGAPRPERNNGASSSARPPRFAGSSSSRGGSARGSSRGGSSSGGGGAPRGGARAGANRAGGRPERSGPPGGRDRFDADAPAERRIVVPAKIDVPSTNWSSPLFASKGAAYAPPGGVPIAADVPLASDGQPAAATALRTAERALHMHLRAGAGGSTLGPVKPLPARALPETERVAREEALLRAVGGEVRRMAAEEAKEEEVLRSAAEVLEQNCAVGPEGKQWVVRQMRELMK